MESGAEAFTYFMQHPLEVCSWGHSLYLFSKENGLGKTTLAHYAMYAVLWTLSRTENYGPKRTYAFESIQSLCKKENAGKPYSTWDATILVIDDLGAESRSALWKKENNLAMLHEGLHHRLDRSYPTIVTSNYTPTALSKLYEGVLDSVLEIQPDGTIGGQRYRQIEVGGEGDFRRKDGYSVWPV